jgi:hypothetical protein
VRSVRLFLAALALACASCGKGNLHPVSGKVLVNGGPAAGAAVFFVRQGGDSMNDHLIMGIVQEDGSFELVCGPLGKGAPPGEYDVLIEWRRSSGHGKGHSQHEPDRLERRYADPKHPLLHATVKAGTNQLDPFELTGPKSTAKAAARTSRRNAK